MVRRVDRMNLGHLDNKPEEMKEALSEASAPAAAAEALWEHIVEQAKVMMEQHPTKKEEIWESAVKQYKSAMSARGRDVD